MGLCERPNQTRFFFDGSATGRGAIRGSSTTRDHPGNGFCSKPCRRAVERVVERERRWREPPIG
jgi:hypothetical protein